MNIGKKLEHWFREARLAPQIFLRYGTLVPNEVTMPHAAGKFHIDPLDERARKKLLFDAVRNRYPINRRFWNDFINALQPDLALDIGANYGECIFSPHYGQQTRAIAFEANPVLITYLEKSRRDHPAMQQIEIINALVDQAPSGARDFYINETASGRSTAVAAVAQTTTNSRVIKVDTMSVDSCLQKRSLQPTSIVFKIDVEGYEPNVLLGLSDSIRNAKTAIGFVEVDDGFLRKSGWTAQKYQEQVLTAYDLYAPIKKGEQAFYKIESLAQTVEKITDPQKPNKAPHFDMILIKKGSDRTNFPKNWHFS